MKKKTTETEFNALLHDMPLSTDLLFDDSPPLPAKNVLLQLGLYLNQEHVKPF